jgi:NAD(P)-dependent dehydrogenase (short-subunit alcohol dehydrogenase family)
MQARRTAVIDPADTPVGASVAVFLAREGFDVAVLGERAGELQNLAVDVLRHGGRTLAIEVDHRELSNLTDAAAEVERHLGPIELWIAIESVAPKSHGSIELSTSPILNGLVAAAQVMATETGVIIAICPALGVRADPGMPAQSAAAFATRGLLQCVRTSLLQRPSSPRLTTLVVPTTTLSASGGDGDDDAEREADLLAVSNGIRRALRTRRATRAAGWDTWVTVQCARFAPRIFDHVQARLPMTRSNAATSVTVRQLGDATKDRARELLHLGPAS